MLRLADIPTFCIEDAGELAEYGATAEAFLLAHKWCRQIWQGSLDFGVGRRPGALHLRVRAGASVPGAHSLGGRRRAVDDCPTGALALKE